MRTFDTGATRSQLGGKPQYEGYLSPAVIRRYGQYMLKHQVQEDGTQRAADNWQHGIPVNSYMDSLVRHVIDLWGVHRQAFSEGHGGESLEDLCCAVMFNVMGYLHEHLQDHTSGGLDHAD